MGLLVFLGVDALDEALETAERVPGALQGVGLVVVGVLGAVAALVVVGGWVRRRRGEVKPLFVAAAPPCPYRRGAVTSGTGVPAR